MILFKTKLNFNTTLTIISFLMSFIINKWLIKCFFLDSTFHSLILYLLNLILNLFRLLLYLFQGFGAGAGSRLELMKAYIFWSLRNITKKFIHESTIFWALGAGSRRAGSREPAQNRRLRNPNLFPFIMTKS